MLIEILGSGCTKCKKLNKNVEEALSSLNVDAEINKVTDAGKIGEYGVMLTPALVIDGDVVSTGKVLSSDEIKKMISNNLT